MTYNHQPIKQKKKDIIFRYEVHTSYPLSIKASLIYKKEREFESKIFLGTHCSFTKIYAPDKSLPEFSVKVYNIPKVDYKVCLNIFIQDQSVLFKEIFVKKGNEIDGFHLSMPLELFKKYTSSTEKKSLYDKIKRALVTIKFW